MSEPHLQRRPYLDPIAVTSYKVIFYNLFVFYDVD